MGVQIQAIAPTVTISRRIQQVAREMNIAKHVSCHVANLAQGLELAEQLERKGTEVFIARRGTAELIREHLPTPLVKIHISLQDMAQALNKARKLTGLDRPRVGVFMLPSSGDELDIFAELLHFELKIYHFSVDEPLEPLVDEAIADGVHAIVAGSVVTQMAQQQQFPTVLLDSGPHSLRAALREAQQIAYARTLEKTQIGMLSSIIQNSSDGTLLLDTAQTVQIANPAAIRILNRERILPGTHVAELFPGLNLDACYAGKSVRNILIDIGHDTILVSMTPSTIGKEIRGIILSFVPTESITALGTAIHKSKYARSFASQHTFDAIKGCSPQIKEAKERASIYACSDAPVLLIGETGTGKELFAHAMHSKSACSQGPFVSVNCAALPPTLLESELFGYEEGAFTGAVRKGKPGLFEFAHQGTIFLDEISEVDIYTQLRLLRVLQEQSTMRIGGHKIIPLKIRIIAASNKDLWKLVQKGLFRKDLFYRLAVLPLYIPKLCDREGDITHIATYAAQAITKRDGKPFQLSKQIFDDLEKHPWPGNVRELLNVIERMSMHLNGNGIYMKDMESMLHPERLWDICDNESPHNASPTEVENPEKRAIENALQQSQWHRGNAARLLGINRTTLHRKMQIYNIKK